MRRMSRSFISPLRVNLKDPMHPAPFLSVTWRLERATPSFRLAPGIAFPGLSQRPQRWERILGSLAWFHCCGEMYLLPTSFFTFGWLAGGAGHCCSGFSTSR
ncbi:hypothetical protein BS50DRAFT_47350 [Corynespora cassiicola Philippines]|uniref:Uncharacterized protein n=1 Tax=Corynespora cassiicola Philippines TaxID=1448308 RepID=A0A2T2NHL2_CORCC|nr:hypothetical protein BS50DRAFT_47350 [Corynespora cassiicola Philippines]